MTYKSMLIAVISIIPIINSFSEDFNIETFKIQYNEFEEASIYGFVKAVLGDKAGKIKAIVGLSEDDWSDKYCITGFFSEGTSLKEALEFVSKMTGLVYKVEGDFIFLTKNKLEEDKDIKLLEKFNAIIIKDISLPGRAKTVVEVDTSLSSEERHQLYAIHPDFEKKPVPIYFGVIEDLSVKYDKDKKGVKIISPVGVDIKRDLPMIDLKEIPLGKLISVICRIAGLKYQVEGDTISITKKSEAKDGNK